jgi:very-short-patch-repair endonuclease
MLAIEVDGASHDFPETCISDLKRQQKVEKFGVHFLRFDEKEVRDDVDSVTEVISKWISNNT